MFKLEIFDPTGQTREKTLFTPQFTVESWSSKFMEEGRLFFTTPRSTDIDVGKQIILTVNGVPEFYGFIDAYKTFGDRKQFACGDLITLLNRRGESSTSFSPTSSLLYFEPGFPADEFGLPFGALVTDLFETGQEVLLTGIAPPTPFMSGVNYYVRDVTPTRFKLSDTPTGAPVSRVGTSNNAYLFSTNVYYEIKKALAALNTTYETSILPPEKFVQTWNPFSKFSSSFGEAIHMLCTDNGLEYKINRERKLEVGATIGTLYGSSLFEGKNIITYDIESDGSKMINYLFIQSKDPLTSIVQNTDSITKYGRRDAVRKLQANYSTQTSLDNFANGMLDGFSEPILNIEIVTSEYRIQAGDTVRINIPTEGINEIRRVVDVTVNVDDNANFRTSIKTSQQGVRYSPEMASRYQQNELVQRIRDLEEF